MPRHPMDPERQLLITVEWLERIVSNGWDMHQKIYYTAVIIPRWLDIKSTHASRQR